jgi:hypothetical protein
MTVRLETARKQIRALIEVYKPLHVHVAAYAEQHFTVAIAELEAAAIEAALPAPDTRPVAEGKVSLPPEVAATTMVTPNIALTPDSVQNGDAVADAPPANRALDIMEHAIRDTEASPPKPVGKSKRK